MSVAEKLIARYNRLDGAAVRVSNLTEYHKEIQNYLDSVGTGPWVGQLKGIYDRVARALKIARSEEIIRLALKPIDLKGKPKQKPQDPAKPDPVKPATKTQKEKNSSSGIGLKDLMKLSGLTYGLEHIQKDAHLDSKPLDGLSDTTYKVITDKILELVKKDGLIWRKPWNKEVNGSSDLAHNHVTKHTYKGGNFYLNYLQFPNPKFFTFDQVTRLGGKVIKDEKAWPVIYFKWLYKLNGKLISEDAALDKGKLRPGVLKFPGLFYYNVFNYSQCLFPGSVGIKFQAATKRTAKEKIESAERILEQMPKRPKLKNGDEAWYSPSEDLVQLVPIGQFKIEQQYYSVAFHELVHSTAHSTRVGRAMKGRFGDKNYAFEELIAELGASYLCGESGILYFTLKNSAAYIKNWSTKLREEMNADPKFFLRAASAAQKAADFMLARGEFHDLEKINAKGKVKKQAMSIAGIEEMVFYHGSKKDFDKFDSKQIGTSTDPGWLGEGFYFYTDISQARQYGKVKAYHLDLENPYFATREDNVRLAKLNSRKASRAFTEKLKSEDYDGVYYDGDLRGEAVVFDADKIKEIKGHLKPEVAGLKKNQKTKPVKAKKKVVPVPLDPPVKEKESVSPEPVKSTLGFTRADQAPAAANTFTLPGEVGRLLGNMQRYKLEIVIAGQTHSSKSELGKQIADAFITGGDEVGWVDWEQGGLKSIDTIEGIRRNVKPENRKFLHVSEEVPKTLDAVKALAKKFKVIVLDSGSSLKQVTNVWIDELREQHPGTVWIILMQQNEKGGTRGGAAAEFDSPIVIKTYRPDERDFRKNYAYVFKNRGNPQVTGKYYLISESRIVDDVEFKTKAA